MATITDYSKSQLDTLLAGKASTTALTGKADLVGGFVPTAQIPALALHTSVPVASQAAMLALTSSQVQQGDLAIRTDGAGTFILTAADPSQLANWNRLNAPTDLVSSVNGQQGTVVLGKADVGLGSVDNTSDLGKPVSTAQATAIGVKATALIATAAKTANYTANPDEIVPLDATSGALTVTLPSAPADQSRVTVKKVDTSTNLVTVAAAGADVFNVTGGVTTFTLALQNQSAELQYAAATGIWIAVGGATPLSQLDARYPQLATPLQIVPVGYYAMPTGGNTGTLALSVNTPIATPLVITRASMTFDSIGINITTAGTTGAVLRLAIFASDADGFPLSAGGNILQTAALAATATGVVSEARAFTLTRGVYWLACVAQVAAVTVESATSVTPNLPRSDGSRADGLTTSSVTGTFFSGYVPNGGAGGGPRVRLHRSA